MPCCHADSHSSENGDSCQNTDSDQLSRYAIWMFSAESIGSGPAMQMPPWLVVALPPLAWPHWLDGDCTTPNVSASE